MTPEKTFTEKMGAAMLALGIVPKGSRNTAQNYDFTAAKDVQARAQKAFAENGLYVKSAKYELALVDQMPTKSGHSQRLVVRCSLTVSDGTSEASADGLGGGADSGDKAAQKGCTASYKYALLALLCGGMGDDPEADEETDKQAGKPMIKTQPEKAMKPKQEVNPDFHGLKRAVRAIETEHGMESFVKTHIKELASLDPEQTKEVWDLAQERRAWINKSEDRPQGETFTRDQMFDMFAGVTKYKAEKSK